MANQDLDAAFTLIDELRRDVDKLTRRRNASERRWSIIKDILEPLRLLQTLGVLLLAFIALGIGAAIYKVATSSGEVEYCYIHHYSRTDGSNAYFLRGRRYWSEDTSVGEFKTLEEAVAASQKINCPLK